MTENLEEITFENTIKENKVVNVEELNVKLF